MTDNGLSWGNAGNISARIDDDRYLITASGTYLGELGEDDFAMCTLSSGELPLKPGRKPSKEVPMHRAVYETRPEIKAVLHGSPFYSTLIACSGETIPSNWFVESMYYLERVERVAYYHPGSRELGEAVREKAQTANVLLLENHGVLILDTSVKEARMAMHTLEMACMMFVEAKGAGIQIKGLSDKIEHDFLHHAGYRARREWQA